MMEASPPPSWYEPPVMLSYVCAECDDAPVEREGDVCDECVEDIRADHAYDAMVDARFDGPDW